MDKEIEMWLPISYPYSTGDPLLRLTRDLLAVSWHGEVRIIACDAKPSLYNEPLFIEAARAIAKRKEARITVILGKSIEQDLESFTGLTLLAKEHNIELLSYPGILNSHFRIIEAGWSFTKELYEEEPHQPYSSLEDLKILNPSYFSRPQWWFERVEMNKDFFDDIRKESFAVL